MTKTLKGIGILLLAIGIYKMMPDVIRYMKIRSM